MPLSGRMNVKAFAASGVREIQGYKTDAWALKGAQILNVHYEINNDTVCDLIPVALRPAIPAYAIFNVTHYPDTPVGPFSIAEVRVGCRAAVRPRGFVLRSYVDSDKAAQELARRWGYPTVVGKVALRAFHDRVTGRVTTADGASALEVEMLDRDFISGNDVQYLSSMQLARNKEDGKLVLVQIDPEWTFSRAERGRPHLIALDSKSWGAGEMLRADWPISASYTVADVSLAPIRYVSDPDQDAFRGTTQVAA